MVLIRSDKFNKSAEILAAIQSNTRTAFTQSVASTSWLFNHSLNRVPSTQLTDLAGNTLLAQVTATSTSVSVQSASPITGIVYIY
jgi:hypothetical protein